MRPSPPPTGGVAARGLYQRCNEEMQSAYSHAALQAIRSCYEVQPLVTTGAGALPFPIIGALPLPAQPQPARPKASVTEQIKTRIFFMRGPPSK